MNRQDRRARSWVHWAALCVALCAILAVWGLWPAEPSWLIIASLCGAFLALLVVESRHRAEPIPRGPVEDLGPVEGDTVAEFLAAVEERFGNGGAVSGAGALGRVVLWNGDPLPPMPRPPGVACGAELGPHRCGTVEAHTQHRCADCATIWGLASFLGEAYPYQARPIPGRES